MPAADPMIERPGWPGDRDRRVHGMDSGIVIEAAVADV
jgi:hypothetical protein